MKRVNSVDFHMKFSTLHLIFQKHWTLNRSTNESNTENFNNWTIFTFVNMKTNWMWIVKTHLYPKIHYSVTFFFILQCSVFSFQCFKWFAKTFYVFTLQFEIQTETKTFPKTKCVAVLFCGWRNGFLTDCTQSDG